MPHMSVNGGAWVTCREILCDNLRKDGSVLECLAFEKLLELDEEYVEKVLSFFGLELDYFSDVSDEAEDEYEDLIEFDAYIVRIKPVSVHMTMAAVIVTALNMENLEKPEDILTADCMMMVDDYYRKVTYLYTRFANLVSAELNCVRGWCGYMHVNGPASFINFLTDLGAIEYGVH